jgi:cytochrome b6-f complex iron-sulfur subunit
MSDEVNPLDHVEALNDFVDALLRGEKPPSTAPLHGDQAGLLRQAAQLASVGNPATLPSPALVNRLRERFSGGRRRHAWLAWRLSRRTFTLSLAGAAAALAVALFGEQAVQRVAGNPPAGWVPVARAADLPPGAVKRFIAQDVEGHIMNIGGRIWALSAVCTHMACVVDWKASDGSFLCPCHGAEFGTDGRQLGGDDYGVSLAPLTRIPVQQRDGQLYVVLAAQP